MGNQWTEVHDPHGAANQHNPCMIRHGLWIIKRCEWRVPRAEGAELFKNVDRPDLPCHMDPEAFPSELIDHRQQP